MKGHQQQHQYAPWKLEIYINNFCDKLAQKTRGLKTGMDLDPFLPDQLCGVICQGKKLHWSPREATNVARHGQQLQDYICDKLKCSPNIFQTVDWEGFYRYIKTLDVRQTNIIKMAHNWIHYGHQKDLFLRR